ncbi:MNT3 (YIL014W) [Zygosaccharomyces parabailii]|uniref:ZYBA0S13-02322g1_1 n=1 Tax=Zygosaccharomyces bailii (strain CLIB 213 / ATCC 58445 / CBS 680 / BCRC 21525 / NBRC 1098 / NCYC 1416 / NRRL Y-2227) TaxID=1333698 RepID=A0A8J2TBC1_ZYGB2|nr:MNT3 (YIL014W) [Zygosaccharomyces parabailii]CDF91733.1 ZYBA0S13-02322g1_1 [Zygosaccharomyces bailii CLIB 213]CDH12341.1 related to Alpha-1,3-mannosyltransferase MNT3 [Zygosaccharomyces bailii ISA1307]
MPCHRFFHPRLLRRNAVLVMFGLMIYFIISASTKSQLDIEGGFGHNSSGRRLANPLSPFRWIENRRKRALKEEGSSNSPARLDFFPWKTTGRHSKLSEAEQYLLVKLDNAPLAAKCRYMVDAIYIANSGWTNKLITKYHGNEEVNDMLASLLSERLRMFDYCFLSGGLKVQDILKMDSVVSPEDLERGSSEDFMQRMFPFLQENDSLWPRVVNLTTKQESRIPSFAQDSKVNFWQNWLQFSKGRGLAVTFDPEKSGMFLKQLRVLQKLNNTLPVQVVTSGYEFNAIHIQELSNYAAMTKQDVSLVDCSPVLDKAFTEENIKTFANKWLAALFNTFEEVVLLDVDSVPFVPLERFLDEPQYTSSGMALFKDRIMMNEHTYSYCIDTFNGLQPSHEENKIMGSRLMFESIDKEFPNTEEAAVYRRFFHEGILHHVDSGLVPVNKKKNFSGLLFSFMLNLDSKVQGCVHGDKELFWLGQLYAGSTYAIYSTDAGVIGLLDDSPMEEMTQTAYHVCASQLAHTFFSGDTETHELVWTNGGMNTCKHIRAAEKDFERAPDYFQQRYDSVQTLQNVYNAPLHVQGMIIPDTKKKPWMQLRECCEDTFCGMAVEDTADGRNSASTLIQFSHAEQEFLDSISFAWCGHSFVD